MESYWSWSHISSTTNHHKSNWKTLTVLKENQTKLYKQFNAWMNNSLSIELLLYFHLNHMQKKNTHKQSEQMYGWSSWEIDKMQTKQIATAIKQKWMHKKPARSWKQLDGEEEKTRTLCTIISYYSIKGSIFSRGCLQATTFTFEFKMRLNNFYVFQPKKWFCK